MWLHFFQLEFIMVTVESVYENHKKKRVSRLSHEAVQ